MGMFKFKTGIELFIPSFLDQNYLPLLLLKDYERIYTVKDMQMHI